MHFSFVSQLMIFGKSDHLTLPQRQQQRPKPGEYLIISIFRQKIQFLNSFHIFDRIFELLMVPIDFRASKTPIYTLLDQKLVIIYQSYESLPHSNLIRPWIVFPA